MVRVTIKIIFVVILNSLEYVIVESLFSEENKTDQRKIYNVNCCELSEVYNISCIEENSPLLSLWEWKNWSVNERYSHTIIDSICPTNSTLDITVSNDDLTQFPLYDDEESPQFIYPQKNGTTVFKNFLVHDERYYTADEYCVSKADSEYVELKVCKQSCTSEDQICFPKCCPLGQSLNVSGNGPFQCLDDEQDKGDFNPPFYYDEDSPVIRKERDHFKMHYYSFNHSCVQKVVSQNRKIESLTKKGCHGRLRLLKNGDLRVRTNTWTTFSRTGKSTYCLESLHNETDVLLAILCNEASLSDPNPIYRKLITAVNVVEGIFTLITTLVYLLLWRKLKNIHRLTQFFHVTSYGALLLIKAVIISFRESRRGQPICFILGLVTNYLVLATGSWMVLINWDLFLMFWNMQHRNSESVKNWIPFCLYGWISPLIPIIIGLILESQYKNDNDTNIVIPEIGKYHCFTSRWAAYYYVIIPITLDYVIVLVLFLITAKVIYNHKQSANFASSAKSSKHRKTSNRQSRFSLQSILPPAQVDNFKLFSRMAALSGLLGLMDMLTVLPVEYYENLKILHSITDHIQGFALFYLYVCNRSTVKELKYLYQNAFLKCRNNGHMTHNPRPRNSDFELTTEVTEVTEVNS